MAKCIIGKFWWQSQWIPHTINSYRSNRHTWKLFVLDRNTWYIYIYICVCVCVFVFVCVKTLKKSYKCKYKRIMRDPTGGRSLLDCFQIYCSQVIMCIDAHAATLCRVWFSATARIRYEQDVTQQGVQPFFTTQKCSTSLSTDQRCVLVYKILRFKSASRGFPP